MMAVVAEFPVTLWKERKSQPSGLSLKRDSEGKIVVTSVDRNSPAFGVVEKGDQLVKVRGDFVNNLVMAEALIDGAAESVELVMRRFSLSQTPTVIIIVTTDRSSEYLPATKLSTKTTQVRKVSAETIPADRQPTAIRTTPKALDRVSTKHQPTKCHSAKKVPIERTPADRLPTAIRDHPPIDKISSKDLPVSQVSAKKRPAEQMPTDWRPIAIRNHPADDKVATERLPTTQVSAKSRPAEQPPAAWLPGNPIVLVKQKKNQPVGVTFKWDGRKVFVDTVAIGSLADGKLLPGDQIVEINEDPLLSPVIAECKCEGIPREIRFQIDRKTTKVQPESAKITSTPQLPTSRPKAALKGPHAVPSPQRVHFNRNVTYLSTKPIRQ